MNFFPPGADNRNRPAVVKSVKSPRKFLRAMEFAPGLPKTIPGKIWRVEIRDRDGAEKSQ